MTATVESAEQPASDTGEGAVQARPRIGIAGAWFDPLDPAVWSGIFTGLITNLRKLDLYGGYRDVMPAGAALAHQARRLMRRTDAGWTLDPDMVALARMTNAARRRRPTPGVDGWIVPVGGLGRPVASPYVTFSELAPSQYRDLGPSGAAVFGFPGLNPSRLQRLLAMQQRAHREAQACCVVSTYAADALIRDHGIPARRVHVVGCGRNVELDAPRDRDWSRPRFLFVGNDWKRKNGDAVVRAFTRLHREIPAARLDVVGLHPPIDEPGVTGHGRLAFTDPADLPRLTALFAEATCFVMPSQLEPFGIVYIEAAAAGVASIATTRGGTATSVGDAGLRVDPDDRDGLVDAMRTLADPATAAELGALARARAAHFSWAHTTRRVLDAFSMPLPADLPPRTPLPDYGPVPTPGLPL